MLILKLLTTPFALLTVFPFLVHFTLRVPSILALITLLYLIGPIIPPLLSRPRRPHTVPAASQGSHHLQPRTLVRSLQASVSIICMYTSI